MKTDAEQLFVNDDLTVKEAMRRLGKVGERILYLVNNKKQLLGSLTDGDIRRWVLAEGALSATIQDVCNKKPIVADESFDIEEIKKIMLKEKIQSIPVVQNDRVVCDVLQWDRVFGKDVAVPKGKISYPVVIMAGGKGTRLDPFTKVLPKPLIPIGEKTILEIIMEKYDQYGINEFYLSINHKSKMIKAYFEEINSKYTLHYLEESKPLGTIGSISQMTNKVKESIIVSNCDIIINSDYHEITHFHEKNDNDITIVGSFRHFVIPYGICHIEDGGKLKKIEEKPEHDCLVNTGMYVVNSRVLNQIPKNQYFNMTDLIEKIQVQNGKVRVYPIDENSWIDVGQWDEYQRAIKLLS